MTITLLHTAEVHRQRFDRIRDRIAPDLILKHVARRRWLQRAQDGIDAALEEEIAGVIARAPGPVLCTCTTLGPVAEVSGAMRVDWPMMRAAAQAQGPVLMAFCLESTCAPSLALLERALAEDGTPQKVYPLPMPQYWPLFEAGEADAFDAVIAGEVRQAVEAQGDVAVVVLAQASMDGAAARLKDLNVPVLSCPELALRAVLDVARG
ncbi:hypothetical protein FIU86_00575 [Roseovarius sp. THAF9]|uniref:hypothetical protein n=1 Tax=Roseovarius sp. THAF9 TaxID=2587847 RepID=UPI0012686FE1|nr:hypothetical protein [Roseovarius sp. THAF9]QFT91321.1 hypothetical protein FIU86_00575 [Roseovarius sp. THAF9]